MMKCIVRRAPAGRVALMSAAGVFLLGPTAPLSAQSVEDWPVHSMDRPVPPIVAPGRGGAPIPPPSDATVLFNGQNLSQWRSSSGGHPGWRVEKGYYFEVVPQTSDIMVAQREGDIVTLESFGDMQLHAEWMIPGDIAGEGQVRGNSGIFFGGRRYEVQILDSYQNRTSTYPDGQAAALYGQYPPLVNASRPPGEWQTYDIIFHGPRFGTGGELLRPARLTVFHNGVLVQDNATLVGQTRHQARPPYEPHPEKMPITLQNHGERVRFRNVWVRELTGAER